MKKTKDEIKLAILGRQWVNSLPRTGAERYFNDQMKDPEYRRLYKEAKRNHKIKPS